MSARIPLIIAFTPNYLIPAATTLLSVLETSTASYEVICLVDQEPSADLMRRMSAIDGGSGRLVMRYMQLGEKLNGAFVDPKYTAAANYRLVIADELPEWEKAIYIDCDVIVRQDLGRLYNSLDMQGYYYLAGIVEASTEYQVKGFTPLGCKAGEYINSGFLVMNLELLRKDKMSAKFVEALRVPYLEFPDQDVLNVVCRGKILFLSPLYNGIRTFMLPAYKPVFLRYYTREQWIQVRRSGTIHYTGGKPWRAYTFLFEKWWECYRRLPDAVREGIPVDKKVERLAWFFSLAGVRPLVNIIMSVRSIWRRSE